MLEKLILYDVIVVIVVVVLLALGVIILKQLQGDFKNYIQRKVKKEIDIAVIDGRVV